MNLENPILGETTFVSLDELDKLRSQIIHLEAKLEASIESDRRQEWLASELAATQKALELARSKEREESSPITLDGNESRTISYFKKLKRLKGGPLASKLGRAVGLSRKTWSLSPQHPSDSEEKNGGIKDPIEDPTEPLLQDQRYENWVSCYDSITPEIRTHLSTRLEDLTFKPLISIILPVFNTPEKYIRQAIQSVQRQIYQNWELCIVDDCSTLSWIPAVLNEYAATDSRIKVKRLETNGHICIASNAAIEMATGTWIALFDHDDLLAEQALALVALAIESNKGSGLIYSDEDHCDEDGQRSNAYFKPDFDPLLLLGQNFVSHLSVFRRDLIEKVGGFRPGYEGSQDWDLVLRVSELLESDQIIHLPYVLYHWRVHSESTSSSLAAKPYAVDAGRRGVSDYLRRTNKNASCSTIGFSGFNRISWDIPINPPTVSVVILPRCANQFVRCISSIATRSTYPNLELVVVDDGEFRPPLRRFISEREGWFTLVRDDRVVSDSALRNSGASAARGDVLCFLHDDTEVITSDWLEEMVGLLMQPDIGAVGAKLLYPDGSIQHAGIVAGIGDTVGNPHRLHVDRLGSGYFGRAILTQSFSAVSWACMAVKREAFEAVGGFDELHLAGLFGDVDFCFRLGEAGWRVGWTPNAELFHLEPSDQSRGTEGENAIRFNNDIHYLHRRWGALLANDPAYNPNLSLAHETMSLAWPPRVSYYI